LSISISFDITLFNGTSIHQPNINHFIDEICKRLDEAIEICDKSSLGRIYFLFSKKKRNFFSSLVNISGQVMEMDFEACKALNFIESGKDSVSLIL